MLFNLSFKIILHIALFFATLASTSIAQEGKPISFTLSIQQSTNHPKANLEFERTDSNIKWFDDKSIIANSDLIYGLTIILNKINLNYRKHTMRGMHDGEALEEMCILTSCFWVSSSLMSGLESNDGMHYIIDNNELWIEKPFYIKSLNSLTISPIIGINITPAKFIITGGGKQESKSVTFPIPFWGVNLEKQLSNTVKVSGEFHHLNYNNSGWGVLYQNYQVGIEKRITKDVDISIGYSKYRLNAEYDKNSKDAKFNLSSDSPFIKISTHF
jgi:hypothetical protein